MNNEITEINNKIKTLTNRVRDTNRRVKQDKFKVDTMIAPLVEEVIEGVESQNLDHTIQAVSKLNSHIATYRTTPQFSPDEYLKFTDQQAIANKQANENMTGYEFPRSFVYDTFNEKGEKIKCLADRCFQTVGKPTIITGLSGAGKTAVALKFLFYNMQCKRRQLFFTGEQTVLEIWLLLYRMSKTYSFMKALSKTDKQDEIKEYEEVIKILNGFTLNKLQLAYNGGYETRRVNGDRVWVEADSWKKDQYYMNKVGITKDNITQFIELGQKTTTIIESWGVTEMFGESTTTNISITEMLKVADLLAERTGNFDVVYVDYLQLHFADKSMSNLDIKSNLDTSSKLLMGYAHRKQIVLYVLAQLSKSDSMDFAKEISKSKKVYEVSTVAGSQTPIYDAAMVLNVYTTEEEDGERLTCIQNCKNRGTGAKGIFKLKHTNGFLGNVW